MKTKKFAGILAFVILMMLPIAAKSQTICFHCIGRVEDGVKHAIGNNDMYMYITFDGNRAYHSDAQGYKTSGNIMNFKEQNGSIQTYCAQFMGNFDPRLGQIVYDTQTGRLNLYLMGGMIYIYERVKSKPQPQMY